MMMMFGFFSDDDVPVLDPAAGAFPYASKSALETPPEQRTGPSSPLLLARVSLASSGVAMSARESGMKDLAARRCPSAAASAAHTSNRIGPVFMSINLLKKVSGHCSHSVASTARAVSGPG
jgi:hypothetical protein